MAKSKSKSQPALTWQTATDTDHGWAGIEKLRALMKENAPGRNSVYERVEKLDKPFYASLELKFRGSNGEGHHVRQEAARIRQRLTILASVGTGASLTTAAKQAGISYETLKAWRRPCAPGYDAEFAAAVERLRGERVRQVESTLFQCAMQAVTNPRYQSSVFFFLKTRAGYREGGEFVADDFALDHPDTMPAVESKAAEPSAAATPTQSTEELLATIAELTRVVNQLRNTATPTLDGVLPILPQ